MKKVLDVCSSPITLHTNFAMPLSIILTKKQFYYWYLERFVQIISNSNKNGYTADLTYFDKGPVHDEVLEKKSYNPQEITSKNSIKEYIISKIDEGYYVKLRLDSFFLSCLSEYERVHYCKAHLIYGYDLEDKNFYGLAYNMDSEFDKMILSFDELMSGYVTKGADYDIILFRPLNFDYKFNLNIFKQNLSNYFNSIETNNNVFLKSDKIRSYGINAYRDFLEYLKLMLTQDDITTIYHNFHLFWEQKKLLLERLNFIGTEYKNEFDLNSVLEEYGNVVKLSNAVRVLYLKTVITDHKYGSMYSPIKDKIKIKELIDKINYITSKEETVIENILHII